MGRRGPVFKSRGGCTNCRRRHLKCDQLGHPCANCISRRNVDTCMYNNGSYPSATTTPPAEKSSPESKRSNSDSSQSSRSRLVVQRPVPKFPRRHPQWLLSLELMHRWSTSTYKSLIAAPGDEYFLQTELPQWALQHDYLLDGIFAFSALEAAICGGTAAGLDSASCFRAALEYYDHGSSSFRAQLPNMTPQNVHCLYMFSTLAVMINMAISQYQCEWGNGKHSGVLKRVTVLMDLTYGSSSIAMGNLEELMRGPLSSTINRFTALITPAVAQPLENSTAAALDLLTVIVKNCAAAGEPSLAEARGQQYQTIVQYLRSFFQVQSVEIMKGGICASLPLLSGKEFALEVANLDPGALFIILYWAVLLDSLGKSVWWAKSMGQALIEEISAILQQSTPIPRSDWIEAISWAKKQAGLSELTWASAPVSLS